jgi:hypothetical protein
VPLSATAPLAPLIAVHESAFWLDQVNVVSAPAVIVVGFAVNVMAGAGVGLVVAFTVILVDALAAPAEPLHDSP